MLEKILFIILIWAMIVCIIYGFAADATKSGGDTGVLFWIYLVQTIKGAYYLTMPIVLFLIACALLKDE